MEANERWQLCVRQKFVLRLAWCIALDNRALAPPPQTEKAVVRNMSEDVAIRRIRYYSTDCLQQPSSQANNNIFFVVVGRVTSQKYYFFLMEE
mmetsp:Transcript_12982/g.27481  ORF Transcript_12982/g.27481 Transcript_12982/m.27481 type:complete len:93 (+) Transcript_12982:791-1069(+)